jgi:CHAD domain-containing protein
MRARPVEGLDPHGPLIDNARLITRVRTEELYSFVPQALDEHEVATLHDMRIAAKRLRYVLELFGFCFGDYAERAREHAKALHSLIGDIHDCDVFIPRLEQMDAGPGLELLIERHRETRRRRFEEFLDRWALIEAEGMRERLFEATGSLPTV